MTLKQLKASLARAKRRAERHSRLARKNRRLAKRRRRQIATYYRGAAGAVRWALAQVGTTEKPAFSNRGPKIDTWQERWGFKGAAWCGMFVGCALEAAGVKGLNSRVAAVAFIEEDARAGRNGWDRLVPIADARAGDAVILFGHGKHVGLVDRVDHARKVVETIEGNTSPGDSGSQDNGGGVYRRVRPFSVVHAVARPDWS